METSLRLRVEGIACSGCARTVREALDALPGVRAEHVAPGEPVVVRYDDALTDPAAIAAAVERAGYRAVLSRR